MRIKIKTKVAVATVTKVVDGKPEQKKQEYEIPKRTKSIDGHIKSIEGDCIVTIEEVNKIDKEYDVPLDILEAYKVGMTDNN